MKHITSLLIACSIAANLVHAQTIPSKDLYLEPIHKSFRYSPKGTYIASYVFQNNLYAIEIFRPNDEKTTQAIILQNVGETKIESYVWIDDNSLVTNYTVYNGKHRMLVTDVSIKEDKIVFKNKRIMVEGYVVDPLPTIEDEVIFAHKLSSDARNYDVHKIKPKHFYTEKLKYKDRLNAGVKTGILFLCDRKHRLRLALSHEGKKLNIHFYNLESKSWIVLKDIIKEEDVFLLQGFLSDDSVAVVTNQDRDRKALVEYNLKETKIVKTIFEPDQGEVLSAEIDSQRGNVMSVSIISQGRINTRYFSSENQAFDELIKEKFPDKQYFVMDYSLDQKYLLLRVLSADDPGVFYHFDVDKKTARPIAEYLPSLTSYKLLKNEHVHTTSVEGFQIDAFLTLPASPSTNFPLIVMPHGGPIGVADLDIFDRDVQFFASRGYGVLRVNFRGSTGYGKAFRDSGRGQWGKKIEDDINHIVAMVKQRYAIDPKNSCIIGGSYGGYSALMSVIRFPDQYNCAVSYFGVSDIPLMFSESNIMKNPDIRRALINTVGDPNKKDLDHHAVSPVYLADKVKVPVLLMAGWNDRVADVEHSHRMYYALKKKNQEVHFVLYPEAHHGHLNWTGDRHQNIVIDAFLRKHLKIDMPDSQTDKDVLINEWIFAGNEFYLDRLVKKDYRLALQFYRDAADLGSAVAQYNVGYMHEHGEGTSASIQKALHGYQSAAKHNNADALYRLCTAYRNGQLDLEKDPIKWMEYLQKAAEQDHAQAQYDLALAYMEGTEIEKDLIEAKNWLQKVVKNSEHLKPKAQEKLKEIEQIKQPQ